MEELLTKRELGDGRWDKILKKRLVELSNADNYDEAKYEWEVTGNVWYIPRTDDPTIILPAVHHHHPHKCLCSHDIVWHFEICNTENGNREIVGSEHIESYMIIRELRKQGIQEEHITEEMIEAWIKNRVKSLKAEWWWNLHGDNFEMMFDAVKEYDLRINVRQKGYSWSSELRMNVPQNLIKKVSTGKFGERGYKMASIVWRWNHPENAKRQIDTRGYPNDRLWNDLQIFYVLLQNHIAECDRQDKEKETRLNQLAEQDEKNRQRVVEQQRKWEEGREERERVQEENARIQEEKMEERRKQLEIAQAVQDETSLNQFSDMCDYYNFPIFDETMGGNKWEQGFLRDMKNRLNDGKDLTNPQLNKLRSILNPNEDRPASQKQLRFLRHLGYEGDEDITLQVASREIERLLEERGE